MDYGEIKAIYVISYWDVTSDYLYSPKVMLNVKNQYIAFNFLIAVKLPII